MSYLRRRISCASVIAFGQKLAGRMSQVGGQAASQATGRREQWGREEEAARREREAARLEKDRLQGHCSESTILDEVISYRIFCSEFTHPQK